ncbi:MAG: hypothetical protein EOP04_24825 [Proteobacteria bacterium]|nr:MAG: hypothetical protein EOP04_24825 [Pseudomonadota bacterium]
MNKHYDDLKVSDRASFVEFINLMQDDLVRNPGNWENPTLDRFLDALRAYTESLPHLHKNLKLPDSPEEASWGLFADILSAAVIYE